MRSHPIGEVCAKSSGATFLFADATKVLYRLGHTAFLEFISKQSSGMADLRGKEACDAEHEYHRPAHLEFVHANAEHFVIVGAREG